MSSGVLKQKALERGARRGVLRRNQSPSRSKIGRKRPIFGKSLRELPNRGYNEPFRLEHIWHDIFLVARKEIVACT